MIINETSPVDIKEEDHTYLTRGEAMVFLQGKGYKHRGKTIILRTIRTLLERGIIAHKHVRYDKSNKLLISLNGLIEIT